MRISQVPFLSLAGLLLAFSVCAPASPQSGPETSCSVKDLDGPIMPACVIRSHNGIDFIPRKYWIGLTFNRYGLSVFWVESKGAVYINRSGRIIIRDVAFIDNGPDDFHHGLVRIHRDKLWGFADSSGRIVVPVQYSCALNYRDKLGDVGPLVCEACRIEKEGEYSSCLGGHWFRSDIHGHLEPAVGP